jgi:hypothetical protein
MAIVYSVSMKEKIVIRQLTRVKGRTSPADEANTWLGIMMWMLLNHGSKLR